MSMVSKKGAMPATAVPTAIRLVIVNPRSENL